MKFRAYVILVAAILVATVLAVVLPGENGQFAALMAVMLAVMTAFSAFISWMPGGAWIERSPRAVFFMGVALEALAALIFVWSFVIALGPAATASSDSNPVMMTSIMIALTGFLLISAPRIARQTREARAIREARARPDRPADGAFDGVREGLRALTTLVSNGGALMRLAGPWVLLTVLPPVIAAFVGTSQTELNAYTVGALTGLVGLIVGLPTVCVAWHRWLVDRTAPRSVVALPGGTAFSYGWRLWIFLSIANRAGGYASDAVAGWMKTARLPLANVAENFVNIIVFGLFCALMGIQAIRLPAVALDDKGLSLSTTLAAAAKMRLALPFGVLIVFGPFLLLQLISQTMLLADPPSFAKLNSAVALQFALMFLEMVAGATFLTRAYLEVKARLSTVAAPSE